MIQTLVDILVNFSMTYINFGPQCIHMGAERTFTSNIENFCRKKGFRDFKQLSYFGLRCSILPTA